MATAPIPRRPTPLPDQSLPFARQDWLGGYESLRDEYDYWIDDVDGEIPRDLAGTLFRNGPGLLDINGQRFGHPFDGDGMICRIAFGDGRAHFCNRFVRTKGFLAEQQANRILYRGVFGTDKPGGWLHNAFDLRLKNIANTNVIYWGGKLLALWEAADPHCLDPDTLATLGIDNIDGALQPGQPFAAHPHVDPYCERDDAACLVTFGVTVGPRTMITIYELDQRGTVVRQHAHPLRGFAFLHDMAITPNYCIFFQNPVTYNPLPFMFGLRSAGECLRFHRGQPTRVLIIPRHRPGPMQVLETDPCFIFHHANAFEQDGAIVVDSIVYDTYPFQPSDRSYEDIDFRNLAAGLLYRFRLDLQTNMVQRQRITRRSGEFPTVHAAHVGRPYRYTYIAATHAEDQSGPFQAIAKVDLQTQATEVWSNAPRGFVNEPIFVPRRGAARGAALAAPSSGAARKVDGAEDDGYVIALTYEAATKRSDVVILDARNLAAGPIARLKLRHHVPYGLHGSFTPERFGPPM